MNRANIHHNCIMTQDARTAKMETGISLKNLIKNFIIEHGTYSRSGGYDVDARDLDTTDKKLFLSHVLSPNDYQEALANPVLLEAEFTESKSYLEMLIESQSWDVYHNTQEEMRAWK
jgi:hypothetical protein